MSTEQQPEWAARLRAALASTRGGLSTVLEEIHVQDLAEVFPDLGEAERIAILEALDDACAGELLAELEAEDRERVLDLLSVERASDILEEMSSDDAADLLADLPTQEADALLEHMEPETAEDVADLLRYPEDTAGGLMAKEFVQVGPDDTVGEVLGLLRSHHDDAEMIYYLYVLDEEERLLGIVSLRRLIVSEHATLMSDIMSREFVSVVPHVPQDEVADLVQRHDLLAVPVLDSEGRMQGIVTVDDVSDVVREEAAEDLLDASGTEETEESPGHRAEWRGWRSSLLALLGGTALAGLVWGATKAGGEAVLYLPLPLLLVLGLIGSSQAAVAMAQAWESEAERRQPGRIFMREALAGLVLALLGAVLAAAVFFLWGRHAQAPAVVAPMGLGLWAASIVGALGALVALRHRDELRSTGYTAIVVVGLLVALVIYLLLARASGLRYTL